MKQDGSRFTLENQELLITVERHGAQLVRIYDKRAQREVLWGGDPAVWGRHAPILFPFVGKSFEGKYRYEGSEYTITSHGFARDMDFEPVLCDGDECWYKLTDTPETLAHYPFPFELEIGHRLEGRTITTMWRVTNRSAQEMLFMIGGHPAFLIPEGKSLYDFSLVFNQEGSRKGQFQEGLHYLAPNSSGYEEARLQGTLALTEGKTEITKGFFETALTYMFDEARVSSVSLLAGGEPYVTVESSDFPYFGVWTMEATHPFICLEPWYGLCASEGDAGELKDRKGIQSLSGWETWQRSYSIRIE